MSAARRRPVLRKPPAAYHHGHLKEALLHGALRLIEQGKEVSLREVARIAGVSPAAPFRHFRDKAALLLAVAEETMKRFRSEVVPAVDAAEPRPRARIHALAIAYLRFALREPSFFRAFAQAAELGLFESSVFREENEATLSAFDEMVREGQARGEVIEGDPKIVQLAARAFVYGLGRMHFEGQFERIGLGDRDPQEVAAAALVVLEKGLFSRRRAS